MKPTPRVIAERLCDLIFGVSCVCCGAAIETGELCGDCRTSLYNQLGDVCAVCGKPADEDECVPELLRMSYIKRVMYASYYDKRLRGNAVNTMILSLKRTGEAKTAAALGGLLAERLNADGADFSAYSVTYPPRSVDSVRLTGSDQAKLLARETARRCGLPFVTALQRSKNDGSTAQKLLGADERFINMLGVFEPDKKAAENGKINGVSFILIDDVTTTGATLFAAAECLRRNGAADIAVLTVSRAAETRPSGAM